MENREQETGDSKPVNGTAKPYLPVFGFLFLILLTSFCVDMPQALVSQGFEGLDGGAAYHRVGRLFRGIRDFGGEFCTASDNGCRGLDLSGVGGDLA
jgi:hypothetical protein